MASSCQVSTGSTQCKRRTCAVRQAVGSVDRRTDAPPPLYVIASARLHSANRYKIIFIITISPPPSSPPHQFLCVKQQYSTTDNKQRLNITIIITRRKGTKYSYNCPNENQQD